MRRSACPQLAPPLPRRRLHRLQATPVVRCAESSCTLPAAPPCAVGVQEPLSRPFVAGTTTSSLTGARTRRQARGRLHPSYTHTNTNTFGPCAFGPCAFGPCTFGPGAFGPRVFKHQHLRPLRLRPLRLAPSCSPGARRRWRTSMSSKCTKNHTTSVSCRVIVDTSARVWALLNKWVAKAILDECCQASMARAEL